jgi:hypothetical protein
MPVLINDERRHKLGHKRPANVDLFYSCISGHLPESWSIAKTETPQSMIFCFSNTPLIVIPTGTRPYIMRLFRMTAFAENHGVVCSPLPAVNQPFTIVEADYRKNRHDNRGGPP